MASGKGCDDEPGVWLLESPPPQARVSTAASFCVSEVRISRHGVWPGVRSRLLTPAESSPLLLKGALLGEELRAPVGAGAFLSPGSARLPRGVSLAASLGFCVSRASLLPGSLKVVSLLLGFRALTARCLVMCACKRAFRVHGAPWVRCRGALPTWKLPAHFFQNCLCPTPPPGRLWFHVYREAVPPLTEALFVC